MIDPDQLIVLQRLLTAFAIGAIIGFERSYRGRPAGLRTHAMVCTASSLLMLLTVFQWDLLSNVPLETIRIDPTRMAQGIMTGIGFLGAGVIMKERLAIRGLTTATSIWMTSAIGILVGMGFYFASIVATIISLLILSLFAWVERKLPSYTYFHLTVTSDREQPLKQKAIHELVKNYKFKCGRTSYHSDNKSIQYEITIHTRDQENSEALSEALLTNNKITAFSIKPLGGK